MLYHLHICVCACCKLVLPHQFAINLTIGGSIGSSPFELIYGEQVRLPVDIIVGNQSRISNASNFVQHI